MDFAKKNLMNLPNNNQTIFKPGEIDDMLRHSQATIKEITYLLNFPSISSLGKMFKAYKGISPNNYRKRYAGATLSVL